MAVAVGHSFNMSLDCSYLKSFENQPAWYVYWILLFQISENQDDYYRNLWTVMTLSLWGNNFLIY
jgi:hypothetical protein